MMRPKTVRPISPPRRISTMPDQPTLRDFGYAPGGYTFNCVDCTPAENIDLRMKRSADKRAVRCERHAKDALHHLHEARAVLASDDPERALRKLLKGHSARVRGLIQANSREVIRRREINAHRKILLRFVLDVCKQLRFYAHNHRDKVLNGKLTDPKLIIDTNEKARVNDELAQEGEEAVIWECPPGAMGKP